MHIKARVSGAWAYPLPDSVAAELKNRRAALSWVELGPQGKRTQTCLMLREACTCHEGLHVLHLYRGPHEHRQASVLKGSGMTSMSPSPKRDQQGP